MVKSILDPIQKIIQITWVQVNTLIPGEVKIPGAHRNGDDRFCTAKTIVVGQSSVYVNGILWAVAGDPNDHGEGKLIQVYDGGNVYAEGKKIIVAVGDLAEPDNQFHPAPPTDPSTASGDVFAYTGYDVAPT